MEISNRTSRGSAAVFGEKDRSPAANYTGPNRRRNHRRGHGDRREEMRFEPNKTDRRVRAGRRVDDKTPKFW